MQSSECTATLKCEGCGMRKPEAERYRPRSTFTVCSKRVEIPQHRKRRKPI